MTTARTFQTFLTEPIDLALGQPHQTLISAASVSIVALEAGTLIPWPFNIALAVGAEWAYLRGLISGAGVKTPWAARLNWSAVLLVIGYGSLWGFRKFHLIPEMPAPWLAIALTLIHIAGIGAVTICSAMLHRAGIDAAAEAEKASRAKAEAVADLEAEATRAYQLELRRRRDDQALELERKQAELELWKQAQAAKASLKSPRTTGAPSAAGTPTNNSANISREQLREHIARTLREQPDANRSDLARQLGIGRTLLYDLITEARARGELEA